MHGNGTAAVGNQNAKRVSAVVVGSGRVGEGTVGIDDHRAMAWIDIRVCGVGQRIALDICGGHGPGNVGVFSADRIGGNVKYRKVVDGSDRDGGRGHRDGARAVGYFVGEAVGAVEVGSWHVVEIAGDCIEADRAMGRLAVDRVSSGVACVYVA